MLDGFIETSKNKKTHVVKVESHMATLKEYHPVEAGLFSSSYYRLNDQDASQLLYKIHEDRHTIEFNGIYYQRAATKKTLRSSKIQRPKKLAKVIEQFYLYRLQENYS